MQEVDIRSGPFTIIPSDLLGEPMPPSSATLIFARLKILVPKMNLAMHMEKEVKGILYQRM